jgi:hypothetical protein
MFLERGLTEAQALGEGLRWSLRIIVGINLWLRHHYFIVCAHAARGRGETV